MEIPRLQPPELGLPKKFKFWRDGQYEVVDQAAKCEKYAHLVDAPTGVGKSLIGVASFAKKMDLKALLARLSGEEFSRARCVYVTRTKQLQRQVLNDFPMARTIVGRSNYPCAFVGEEQFPDVTAEDCPNPKGCTEACAYKFDKHAAVAAPIAVLNDAYFLTEANAVGQFSNIDWLILDEVDSMEASLMSHIQLTISERQLTQFKIAAPVEHERRKLSAWIAWSDQAAQLAARRKLNIQGNFENVDPSRWTDVELDLNRQSSRLESFGNKLKTFQRDVNEYWVLDYDTDAKSGWKATFKPVMVAEYTSQYLWRHAKHVLGMSGTIFDPDILASDLGLADFEYQRMDSPFPVENRPIYFQPVVNMKYRNMDTELPKLADAVAALMGRYPDDRILVHTVSYRIRDYLLGRLPQGRLLTHTSDNREDRLEMFRGAGEPFVLLSPSFDRGVDLPDEACLVPGTLVRTLKGYKPIEEIRVGDRVFTHTGKFRRVTRTMQREYDGLVYDIETYGGYHHKITSKHPVRVTGAFPREIQKATWLSAEQLSKGMRTRYPVSKWHMNFKDLGKRYITGHRKSAHVYQSWESSPLFWRLVGLWAAEGNISVTRKNRRAIYEVVWSFSEDERDSLVKETCFLISQILGNKAPTPGKEYHGGCRVSIKNAPFARWLIQNVGSGSKNKRVPTRLFYSSSEEEKQAFISGVLDGDGFHKGNNFELGIVAPQLALGVRDLLLAVGQPAGVGVSKKGVWCVRFNIKPTKKIARISSGDLLSRIRNVKEEYYCGLVYNLSVEKDESYSLVGLCVHNCRCVIVCKVPYLGLSDQQTKIRLGMKGGERWYNLRAAQTIVQMSGRAVRSKTDHADTWILDRQFDSLLARVRHILPKWWLEAIKRV